MRIQANTKPKQFVKIGDITQVNYNIQKIEITDDLGTRMIWEYDYIEIEGEASKARVLAMIKAKKKNEDPGAWTPDEIMNQYADAENAINLSGIADMTYAQVDAHIDLTVVNLASARTYLKKLSRVVLATLKQS